MRLDVVPDRSFEGSSPVCTYWLARCEGFRVRLGRRRGVVRDVALDATTGTPQYLVVRFALGRTVVDVDQVESLVPAQELLVLRRRERRPPRIAPAARRAREVGRRSARSGGRAALRAATATRRGTARAARATARETQRLRRRLAPRAAAAARAFGRAVAAGAVLVAAGLAAIARMLHGLAVAGATRLRAEVAARRGRRGSHGLEDEGRPAAESGRARQHAA